MSRKPWRSFSWNARGFRSKRVSAPGARLGAGEAEIDRKIEDERQVRREIAGDEAVERLEVGAWHAARRSPDRPEWNWRNGRSPPSGLASSAGQTVAVRWQRRAATISSASPTASQRDGSPSTRSFRISSAPAAPPGSRVASASMPASASAVDQPCDLRRLAGAFAAFDGDEPAARQRFFPSSR